MNYLIKKSNRAKKVRITVKNNSEIILTIPKNIKKEIGINFLNQKKDWILNKIKNQKKVEIIEISKKDYLKNKKKVHDLVLTKINYYNSFYKFKINNIVIRNQKQRWGSCSSKLNLNFNYAILYLEEDLFDYVIIHELCHLKEMNHSSDFWKLVSLQDSDYLENRKKLKNKSFKYL